MADLNEALQDHYADQELDEAVMERLLAMETAPAPAPRRNPWPWRVAAGIGLLLPIAASGLLVTLAVFSANRGAPLEAVPGHQRDTGLPSDGVVSKRAIPRPARRPAPRPSPDLTILRGGEVREQNAPRSDRQRAAEATAVEELRVARQMAEARRRMQAPEVVGSAGDPGLTAARVLATSTFAVDTDTAAWTRARRTLSEGILPRPDEVRAEEFINSFRYDYEPPSTGAFAVSSELVPSTFAPDAHLLRIGIQGRRVSVFERKPVHLTFLVDVSGSMNRPDKLGLAQQGMRMLVDQLRDGDTVAIVTYAGSTGIALQPTSALDRTRLHRAIDALTSSGGTAMGVGIDLAYGLAEQTLEPGAINRVVLMSDGDANIGERDADRLAQRLRAAADKGITLTTLGFGSRAYRDDVMEKLADKGDGQYHYLGDERDAKRILVDDLTGMLEVIARDVKLQVEFDPTVVEAWRLIGYENRRMANRDFRNDAVDAGEIGSGHQVTALYEVTLKNPGKPVGQVRVRYEAPGAEGSPAAERSFDLAAKAVATLSAASAGTRMAVVAASFAERLRGRTTTPLSTLLDLVPDRPEYRERDEELVTAIRAAMDLGLE